MTTYSQLNLTSPTQNFRSVKVCPNPNSKIALGMHHWEQKRHSHIERSNWVKMTHVGTKKGISQDLSFDSIES
jgi:hypothetical protein